MSAESKQSIHVLNPLLANQIAAGEVVERPASVIKELLENSFDAKATDVLIEIEQGGQQLMRIRDNGVGIDKTDLALALSRHATSKIKEVSDLAAIHSLGFRGEALASIASVSRVELASRVEGSPTAYSVQGSDGLISDPKPVAHPQGTTISVRDLFYNTPARRKFLRTPNTEMQYIQKTVYRLALSHFETAFKLKNNQREILSLPVAKTQQEKEYRLAKILGKEFLSHAFYVEFESAGMKLYGWLAESRFSRAKTDMQYLYINHRFVRDKVLAHALREAYHDVMFHGRFPAFVLFLDIDAKSVDVNVHPTKHEVRFRESHTVHDFVRKGVKDALSQIKPGVDSNFTNPPHSEVVSSAHSLHVEQTNQLAVSPAPHQYTLRESEPAMVYEKKSASLVDLPTQTIEKPALGFAVGQLKQTYILAENDKGLVVVDMHAAHERVLYEKLKLQHQANQLLAQPLLVPIPVALSSEEMMIWQEKSAQFTEMGIVTEQSAPNEIMIREIPHLLKKANMKQLVQDTLSDWLGEGASERARHHINAILGTIACHAAFRSPHPLTIPEMNALLREMEQTTHGGLCNHGRPTWKQFSLSEMDQWFFRGR